MKSETLGSAKSLHIPSTKNRQGETGSAPFRSKRFYTVNTGWFFHTREGITQGPYHNLLEAKSALKLYLRRCGIVSLNG